MCDRRTGGFSGGALLLERADVTLPAESLDAAFANFFRPEAALDDIWSDTWSGQLVRVQHKRYIWRTLTRL